MAEEAGAAEGGPVGRRDPVEPQDLAGSSSGVWVPTATMKSRAAARAPKASRTARTSMGSGQVRVGSGVSTSTRRPSTSSGGVPARSRSTTSARSMVRWLLSGSGIDDLRGAATAAGP